MISNNSNEDLLLAEYSQQNDKTLREHSRTTKHKAWWDCSTCGYSWQASISNRRLNGSGCPACANKTLAPGRNDMATRAPMLAASWHPSKNAPLTPRDVIAGTHKKLWWLCSDCGHEWQRHASARLHRGSGCPACAGRLVVPGNNDLATLRPKLAAQYHPSKNTKPASQIHHGSNTSVWWLCPNGHSYQASPNRRIWMNTGCAVCSGKATLAGSNDLATMRPDIAACWDSQRNAKGPQSVTVGSRVAAHWKCPKGHRWTATVHDVTAGKSNCPTCANKKVLLGYNDLATTHPAIAALWHPDKNGALTPHDVLAGSRRKVWVQCPEGHAWISPVHALTSEKSHCPSCKRPSSQIAVLTSIIAALLPGEQIVTEAKIFSTNKRWAVDIYVPGKRFAIEYNGVYFHSEASPAMNPHYHAARSDDLREQGITLLHLWEDDWLDPRTRSILVRMIATRLGATHMLGQLIDEQIPTSAWQKVGARKLSIASIETREANQFLAANHLQGHVIASTHLALLDHDGQPRAVLSLQAPGQSKRNPSQQATWTIVRYATCGVVPGGFTRLLGHAEQSLPVQRWLTFADLSISNGNLYQSNGFVLDKKIKPDYKYAGSSTRWVRKSKNAYQRSRFRRDDALLWDESWTEAQAAQHNQLHRIWDAGKLRFVKDVA